MSNTSLFDRLSRSLGLLRRSRTAPETLEQAPRHAAAASPGAYTLNLQRDEVALGRFIKRLSVSGAENIQVAYPEDGIVRISMEHPTADETWESTIGELLDRCCLQHAT